METKTNFWCVHSRNHVAGIYCKAFYSIAMDKSSMNKKMIYREYINGVKQFVKFVSQTNTPKKDFMSVYTTLLMLYGSPIFI